MTVQRILVWLKDAALTVGVTLLVLGALWLFQEVTTGELSGWRTP